MSVINAKKIPTAQAILQLFSGSGVPISLRGRVHLGAPLDNTLRTVRSCKSTLFWHQFSHGSTLMRLLPYGRDSFVGGTRERIEA